MGRISALLRDTKDGVLFWCPGCKSAHGITVAVQVTVPGYTEPEAISEHNPDGWIPERKVPQEIAPKAWGWNGNFDKPTFSPSILVRGRGFTPKGQHDFDAWHAAGCPKIGGSLPQFDAADTVCHSFVTDGRIQFLGDCTHELAGQTVDLPPWSA